MTIDREGEVEVDGMENINDNNNRVKRWYSEADVR
jgi:hypothetical protein